MHFEGVPSPELFVVGFGNFFLVYFDNLFVSGIGNKATDNSGNDTGIGAFEVCFEFEFLDIFFDPDNFGDNVGAFGNAKFVVGFDLSENKSDLVFEYFDGVGFTGN